MAKRKSLYDDFKQDQEDMAQGFEDTAQAFRNDQEDIRQAIGGSSGESKSSGKWIWETGPEEGSVADLVSKGVKGLSNFLRNRELKKTLPERTSQVLQAIEEFKPARAYGNEFPYQTDLRGWLKSKFPNTEIEIQKGSSRPDIVIDDIAIEVKGPTRDNELKSIADKCMRYPQHFNNLLIVLFEVQVNQRRYDEWVSGMKITFPQAIIIRK